MFGLKLLLNAVIILTNRWGLKMLFELDNQHTLLEIAHVGSFCGYKVSIYGGEGNIPHLHFYTENKKKNIYGCIRLDCSEYFDHGKHNARLNSKEKKIFTEWIKSKETPFKKFTDILTVWEYVCILWNENNPNYKFNYDQYTMPNYAELN